MMLSQLPDGSWATSVYFVGRQIGPCCPDDYHVWKDQEYTKQPVPEDNKEVPGMKFMTIQVCERCHWSRTRLTEE